MHIFKNNGLIKIIINYMYVPCGITHQSLEACKAEPLALKPWIKKIKSKTDPGHVPDGWFGSIFENAFRDPRDEG